MPQGINRRDSGPVLPLERRDSTFNTSALGRKASDMLQHPRFSGPEGPSNVRSLHFTAPAAAAKITPPSFSVAGAPIFDGYKTRQTQFGSDSTLPRVPPVQDLSISAPSRSPPVQFEPVEPSQPSDSVLRAYRFTSYDTSARPDQPCSGSDLPAFSHDSRQTQQNSGLAPLHIVPTLPTYDLTLPQIRSPTPSPRVSAGIHKAHDVMTATPQTIELLPPANNTTQTTRLLRPTNRASPASPQAVEFLPPANEATQTTRILRPANRVPPNDRERTLSDTNSTLPQKLLPNTFLTTPSERRPHRCEDHGKPGRAKTGKENKARQVSKRRDDTFSTSAEDAVAPWRQHTWTVLYEMGTKLKHWEPVTNRTDSAGWTLRWDTTERRLGHMLLHQNRPAASSVGAQQPKTHTTDPGWRLGTAWTLHTGEQDSQTRTTVTHITGPSWKPGNTWEQPTEPQNDWTRQNEHTWQQAGSTMDLGRLHWTQLDSTVPDSTRQNEVHWPTMGDSVANVTLAEGGGAEVWLDPGRIEEVPWNGGELEDVNEDEVELQLSGSSEEDWKSLGSDMQVPCSPLDAAQIHSGPILVQKPKIKANPLRVRKMAHFRQLAEEPHETIVSWFTQSGITLGDMAKTPDQRILVMRLCFTYRDCFKTKVEEVHTTDLIEHTIPLIPGTIPPKSRPRRYNRQEREVAQIYLPPMEKFGLITRANSPWGARTRFVPKPTPNTFRVVHDYRPVNSVTLKSAYPCHDLETDIDSVYCGRPRVFSQADASNGFWGIPIYPPDRYKTGFTAPHGQFCYNNMPQGLTGSPTTYARFGDMVFGHLFFEDESELPSMLGYMDELSTTFFIYVDDHNIASETFEDHFEFLWKCYFPRIAWAPICLSGKKTTFFVSEVESLGFSLGSEGIRPAAKHRDKFESMGKHFEQSPPRSWEDVQVLLYLTPFVRKFIPGRAELVHRVKQAFFEEVPKTTKNGKPSVLREEVKRETPIWDEGAAKALKQICDSVHQNATHGAKSKIQFHLATDASEYGTGGVLLQLEGHQAGDSVTDRNFGDSRIIMWISGRLNDAERRYTMPEKEMLAVVRGLKETEWLTSGSPHPIKVYTDHKGIVDSMANHQHMHGKVSRWIDILGEFDVEFIHRPNTTKIMRIADGMSRLPDPLREEPILVEHRLSFERSCNMMLLPGGPAVETTHTVEVSELMKEWMETDWYGEITRYLIEGRSTLDMNRRKLITRRALRYRIIDHRLYYVENCGSLALCITQRDVPLALQDAHDACGHFANVITMQNLRGERYWPSRAGDVENYCRSCLVCQQTSPRLPRSLPNSIAKLGPWDMVAMDYLGPITPTSSKGHAYILLIADYMTRFIGGAVHLKANAEEVAREWESGWGATFGWPRVLYCDNGSHFKNTAMKLIANKHGTILEHGPVSHPQSTGLVERTVRLVKNQLMKWAVERNGDSVEQWHEALPQILVTLNSRHVDSLGTSPGLAMFGFQPFSKHAGVLDTTDLEDTLLHHDRMAREVNLFHIEAREEERELIRDEIVVRQALRDPPSPRSIRIGTLVWEKQDKGGKLHGKFHQSWGNLSVVLAQLSSSTYLTQNLMGPKTERKVHVDDLKPFVRRLPRLEAPRLNRWDMADYLPADQLQRHTNLEDED
ncbi:hypothetical protein FDECE_1511 [Fusarium decemcellulare]|nr:hypothetical protein FDECE_1511 [Fusarium decemcellulare]